MCGAHFLKKAGPEPPSKTQRPYQNQHSEWKCIVTAKVKVETKYKELFDKGHAHNIYNKNKNAHIRVEK